MRKQYLKHLSNWDIFSGALILLLSILQIMRWRVIPQFMDVFYHLINARSFMQAGGYSGRDFWQYAPFGRVNVYPPFFHLLLAGLMKLGMSVVFLAKFFETATPLVFVFLLWRFMRRYFSQAFAFFVLVAYASAFAFHLSLMNHLPSTLAMIFGLLVFDQLFKQRLLRAVILLTLCFYTHIGVAWFFALALIFYLCADRQYRRSGLIILCAAITLALPILVKQILALKLIDFTGLRLGEKYFCQIKFLDYCLAATGLFYVLKEKGKYYLLVSFLLASLVFLPYPYRFISAEGYLPIILLCAFFLFKLWEKWQAKARLKNFFIIIILFFLIVSPTLSLSKLPGQRWHIKIPDALLTNMVMAQGVTMWYPQDYFPAAALIRAHSEARDIVYCNLGIFGVVLGSIADRATANALLTEVKVGVKFDPILTSKIIILANDTPEEVFRTLPKNYNLEEVGKTRIFTIYKNPAAVVKNKVAKAMVSFWLIGLIGILLGCLWVSDSGASTAKKEKK